MNKEHNDERAVPAGSRGGAERGSLSGNTRVNASQHSVSTPRWVIAGRIVSSLFCLFVLAVAIPNLGSVTLPDHRIGYGWRDALSVAVMITPLIVIFVGAIFSRVVEYIGWALALGLLAWCMVAYQMLMAA